MKKNQIIGTIIAVVAAVSGLHAQSKSGLALVTEERWWSAEKEFSKSKEEADVFYTGLCQVKKDELDAAKTTFNSISTTAFGKVGLGLLELNASNNAGAQKLFEEANASAKGKNAELLIAISRAIIHSKANDKEKAIEWASKAVELNKSNLDYKMALGEAYSASGDGGSANNQYESIVEKNPKSAIAYAKIAQVYFRGRLYSLMRENLDKALAIDPNHLFSLSYMGDLMYKSKSFDSAKIYQSRLLELGDKNPIDRAMMANILYLGKDYEGAIALIQEIISGDNKYTYLNRLIGYSYFETKKPNEAITFLEKFIQTEPKEKIIGSDYEYLAKSYTAAGQPEKGIEVLNSALILNPNDKDLMIQIAKEYKDLKKLDEALMMYQKILALTDPAPTADDYKNQANLYFSKKDWVNAEAGYTKVLELAPTSTMVYYNRASVKSYADPEQTTASAKPDFVKFMELATGNEAYKKQLTKANLYMAKDAIKNLSDKVAGKGFLDAALALDPTNAEALELMKFVE